MAAARVVIAAFRSQSPRLLAATVTGWCLLLAVDQSLVLSALCGPSAVSGLAVTNGLAAALTVNPPALLLLAWAVMLLAMMPPLLVQPMTHIWVRSLTRRRWRGMALFVVGYGAVWLAAGAVLTILAILLTLAERATGVPALLFALALALLWQLAPLKQSSLNRCHRLARLSAFGWQADRDCLVYGVTHAVWCVNACWALMLVPLVAGPGHLIAMAIVTVLLIAERFRPAQPARWGIPLPARLRDLSRRLSHRPIAARATNHAGSPA